MTLVIPGGRAELPAGHRCPRPWPLHEPGRATSEHETRAMPMRRSASTRQGLPHLLVRSTMTALEAGAILRLCAAGSGQVPAAARPPRVAPTRPASPTPLQWRAPKAFGVDRPDLDGGDHRRRSSHLRPAAAPGAPTLAVRRAAAGAQVRRAGPAGPRSRRACGTGTGRPIGIPGRPARPWPHASGGAR
jgi:hypothetical protein